jgi:hypothetical protein
MPKRVSEFTIEMYGNAYKRGKRDIHHEMIFWRQCFEKGKSTRTVGVRCEFERLNDEETNNNVICPVAIIEIQRRDVAWNVQRPLSQP